MHLLFLFSFLFVSQVSIAADPSSSLSSKKNLEALQKLFFPKKIDEELKILLGSDTDKIFEYYLRIQVKIMDSQDQVDRVPNSNSAGEPDRKPHFLKPFLIGGAVVGGLFLAWFLQNEEKQSVSPYMPPP